MPNKTEKPVKCSICKKPIEKEFTGWQRGHNAWPVTDGRCCRTCNDTIVVPIRVKGLVLGSKKT